PSETEPNNTVPTANPLQPGTKGFTASLWPLGDIDVFKFDVTVPGSRVAVATSDGMGGGPKGAHTYVRVFDKSLVVLAVDRGANGCASLSQANSPALLSVAAGTYYVHVENAGAAPIPFYILDISVTPPSCGDGFVQISSGEQCDHGAANGATGD